MLTQHPSRLLSKVARAVAIAGGPLRRGLALVLLTLALLLPAPVDAQSDDPAAPVVSFPGNYGQAIGLPSWAPDDAGVTGSDADGDGLHTLAVSLPRGSWEFKVAINGSWDENYGQRGEPDGANIPFTLTEESDVVFGFDVESKVISVTVDGAVIVREQAGRSLATVGDGNLDRDALLHVSRSDLFRSPFGAQPFDTDVTLRLRTAARDAEQVLLLVDTLSTQTSFSQPMQRVASDGAFDWWEVVLNSGNAPVVHNYKFQIVDGGVSLFYADDLSADQRLGGAGVVVEGRPLAQEGWDLYVYDPAFAVPAWAQDAIIYQIFPDRFRNGDPSNDPRAGDFGYPSERGDIFPIAPWNYIVPDPDPSEPSNPWNATWNSTFYGGDLQGVLDKLDYLQDLGVNTIYFTPIHEAHTNHRYDATDYRTVDDTLAIRNDPEASQAFLENFAAAVDERGMRLILDAVPNHTSSDNPLFDLYERHPEVGACEAMDSPSRDLYRFMDAKPAGSGVCAGDVNYFAFAGVPTLPQADTTSEAVIDEWLGEDGIAMQWLELPAVAGWRVDTVPELTAVNPQFFELWRTAMKAEFPDALLVSETWQEELVRERLLGEEFDTTMNYRFPFNVLAFVRGQPYTEQTEPPLPQTDAAMLEEGLRAIQEDYPPAAFNAAMNLLSSHDIQRAVRLLDVDGVDFTTMTPVGEFADGRARLALAAVLQFTLPGAPTVFYGDEVGLVGFGRDPLRDDPHNRQPYPWSDEPGYDDLPAWRQADTDLLAHYQTLGALRSQHSYLRAGDWTTLVAEGDLYAYVRADATGAAVVAINRGDNAANVTLDLAGLIPFGAALESSFAPESQASVGDDGALELELPGVGFAVWTTAADVEMSRPAAPTLEAVAGSNVVTLTLSGLEGDAEAVLYRSLVDGGFEEVQLDEAASGGIFVDESAANGQRVFYRAVQRSETGMISEPSASVSALPAAQIVEATLAGPFVMTHTISAITATEPISGLVVVEGAGQAEGEAPALLAELGLLPEGMEGYLWTPGTWVGAQDGGHLYTAALLPRTVGNAIYRWRFSADGGESWVESDAGTLTVVASDDTEAPKPPFRMDPIASTSQYLAFAWRVSRPRDLYNFRICRADLTAGEEGCALEFEAPKTSNIYTDTQVTTGHTYSYTVQVVDTSFNVSEASDPIALTAELSMAEVTFRMRVPAGTPPEDTIYIAGNNPDVFGAAFNPMLMPLTPAGDGIWEITLQVKDGEQLEYKYTRGSWEQVEQWGNIAGFANRRLTVSRTPEGTMLVDNTSTDWAGDTPDDLLAPQFWRDPLVTATEPAADGVGSGESIRVDLSIPASADTPERVITVVDEGGEPVAGEATMESATTWVWLPEEPLDPGAYTATVDGLEATAAMVAPYIWNFTVE